MAQDYRDELAIYEATLDRESDLPTAIVDDQTGGEFSDYMKKLKTSSKTLDAIRKSEKEVYSSKANAVHNFFKKRMDNIDQAMKRVDDKLAEYVKKKADAEKRAREEKERIAREESDRKAREMEEQNRIAQEKIKAAEEAAREAERKLKEAEETAKKEAAEIQRKADEAARIAKAKADEEAAAQQKIIDDLRAKEKADQEKIDQAQREADRKIKEAEDKAAEEAAKVAEAAAKQIEESKQAVKQLEKDLDVAVVDIEREARYAINDTKAALDEATRADQRANKIGRFVNASLSELSRLRGDTSMASLSEYWIGTVEDRAKLDLEALREHIPFAALEAAVQSFVTAGGRQLRGAVIFQDMKSVVR